MNICQSLNARLNRAFTCSLLSSAGALALCLQPITPNTSCIALALALCWFAAYREMERVKRLALYVIDVTERVNVFPVQAGDRIGTYCGAPIFEWVKTAVDGPRYDYTGTVRVHTLEDDEVFVWPGLIYRSAA